MNLQRGRFAMEVYLYSDTLSQLQITPVRCTKLYIALYLPLLIATYKWQ